MKQRRKFSRVLRKKVYAFTLVWILCLQQISFISYAADVNVSAEINTEVLNAEEETLISESDEQSYDETLQEANIDLGENFAVSVEEDSSVKGSESERIEEPTEETSIEETVVESQEESTEETVVESQEESTEETLVESWEESTVETIVESWEESTGEIFTEESIEESIIESIINESETATEENSVNEETAEESLEEFDEETKEDTPETETPAWEEIEGLSEYDDDIYFVKYGLFYEYNTFLYYFNQMNKEDEVASMLFNNINNDSFTAAYALWKTATFSPKDAASIVLDEYEVYESLILEVLADSIWNPDNSLSYYSSFMAVTSATSKCEKKIKEVYGVVEGFAKSAYGIEYLKDLDYSAMSKIEQGDLCKMFNDSMKESFPYFSEIADSLDVIDKVFSQYGICTDIIDSFVAYSQCYALNEYMKQVIRDMYHNCPGTDLNYPLKLALKNIMRATENTSVAYSHSMFMLGIKEINTIVGEVCNIVFSEVIGSTGVGAGLLIGQKIGKGISNLMFSTDAIFDEYYKIKCYREIKSVLHTTIKNEYKRFLNQENKYNACVVKNAVILYINMINQGYDLGKSFYKTIRSDGLWNKIVQLFTGDVSVSSYNKQIESIRKNVMSQLNRVMCISSWYLAVDDEDYDAYKYYYELVWGTDIEPSEPVINPIVPVEYVYFDKEVVEWGLRDGSFNGGIAHVYPENATYPDIEYSVSPLYNIYYGMDGKVHVYSEAPTGEYTITATSKYNGVSAVLKVNLIEGHGEDGVLWSEAGDDSILDDLYSGVFQYYLNDDGDVVITGYTGDERRLKIPKTIDYKNVVEIEKLKLTNPTKIEEIYIQEGVIRIGSDAFSNCTALEYIMLPESLESVGYRVFDNTKISSLSIPGSVTVYDDGYSSYSFLYGADYLETVTIEEGATCIQRELLQGNENIVSVTLPESLLKIEAWAFKNCTSLVHVYGGKNIQSIGIYAFQGCNSLTEICGGDSVESIGYNAYEGCTSLRKVILPSSLAELDPDVFYNCSSLMSIVITGNTRFQTGVSYLAKCCPQLSSISITGDNSYYQAIDGCLYEYTDDEELTLVLYPPKKSAKECVLPENASGIYGNVLENMYLRKLTIPHNGVYFELYKGQIQNTYHYEVDEVTDTVIITDLYPYVGDIAIPSVIDGKTVTSIGTNIIKDIPDENKKLITKVTIPDTITAIGNYPFAFASNITEYVVDADNKVFLSYDGIIYTTDGKLYLCPEGKIGKVEVLSVCSEICSNAFADCIGLEEIVLSDSIEIIGEYAFSRCPNLKSISLPASIKSIGDYAFRECSQLVDVELPVCSYGESIFDNCSSLEFIKITGLTTEVPENAFAGFYNGVTLILPDSITKIGDSAFKGSDPAILSDNLISIGANAFENCKWLTDINLSQVTELGNGAFKNCTNLSSVIIPEGITTLGEKLFYGCKNLSSVRLPDSLIEIEDYVFNNCTNLAAITIPRGVTVLNSVFSGCSSLKSVTLPDTLTKIRASAFSGCSSLETLQLPVSIKMIGDFAFDNCSSLKELAIPEGMITLDLRAFDGCGNLEKLIIPRSIDSICNESPNESLTIYGYQYSKAEQFAKEEGIRFVCLSDDAAEWTYSDGVLSINGKTIISSSMSNGWELYAENVHTVLLGTEVKYICPDVFTLLTEVENVIFSGDVCPEVYADAFLNMEFNMYFPDVWSTDNWVWSGNASFIDAYRYTGSAEDMLKKLTCVHEDTSIVPAVPATCKDYGYSEGVYCNVCNSLISGHCTTSKLEYHVDEDNDTYCDVCGRLFVLSCDTDYHLLTYDDTYLVFNPKVTAGYVFTIDSGDENSKIGGSQIFDEEYDISEEWYDYTDHSEQLLLTAGVTYYIHIYTEDEGAVLSITMGCTHEDSVEVPEVPGTCIENGYTSGIYCIDCGQFISGHKSSDKSKYHVDENQDGNCDICGKGFVLSCDIEFDLSESDATYMVFVPDTTADYTFIISSGNEDYSVTRAFVFDVNNDVYKYWSYFTDISESLHLTAGVTYYISVYTAYEGASLRIEAGCFHQNTQDISAVKATCQTKGYTAGVYCYDCGEFISGHSETRGMSLHTDADSDDICDLCEKKFRISPEQVFAEVSENKGCLEFTPNVNGIYKLSLSHVNDVIVYLNEDESRLYSDSYLSDNYTHDMYLKAENTYYFELTTYSSEASICITKECDHLNSKVVPQVDATCQSGGFSEGIYCLDCSKYISGHFEGMVSQFHTDVNHDAKCDVCSRAFVFSPDIKNYVTENDYHFYEFVPEVSGTYTFEVHNNSSSYLGIYRFKSKQTMYGEMYGETIWSYFESTAAKDICTDLLLEEGVTYSLCLPIGSEDMFILFKLSCKHENRVDYDTLKRTCCNDGYSAGYVCIDCGLDTRIVNDSDSYSHKDENLDGLCDLCGAQFDVQLDTIYNVQDGEEYFSFTPAVNGLYHLKANSEYGHSQIGFESAKVFRYEGWYCTEDDPDFKLDIYVNLEAEKTYLCHANADEDIVSFSISLECSHQNSEIRAEIPVSCDESGYTEGLYCFTCGDYVIGHEQISVTNYHTDRDDDGVCDLCSTEFAMKCDQVYAVAPSPKQYLEFTPSVSGKYDFELNWAGTCYYYSFYLYKDKPLNWLEKQERTVFSTTGNVITGVESKRISVNLQSGVTYYIDAYLSMNIAGVYSIQVVPGCSHANTVTIAEIKATCTNAGYTEGIRCSDCGELISGCDVLPTLGHAYKTTTTKATDAKAGKIVTKCSNCGDVKSSKPIAYVKTVTLSAETVEYNGKTRTPSVTVKDSSGKVLIKDTDYTVTYASGRKDPGIYAITVKGKGNYSYTKKINFTITPVKAVISSVVSVSSGMKVTWGKVASATGYKIYRKANSGSYIAVKTISGNTTVSFTDTGAAKNGTKYTYYIKAYNKSSSGTVYAADSAAKAMYFIGVPGSLALTNSSAGKLTIKWAAVSGTGYEIQYSTSSSFGSAKTVTITSYKTTAKSIAGLTKGKKYYVRIRAYKTISGKKYYSDWSAKQALTLSK